MKIAQRIVEESRIIEAQSAILRDIALLTSQYTKAQRANDVRALDQANKAYNEILDRSQREVQGLGRRVANLQKDIENIRRSNDGVDEDLNELYYKLDQFIQQTVRDFVFIVRGRHDL